MQHIAKYLAIALPMLLLSDVVWGGSRLRHEQERRLRRDMIKAVQVKQKGQALWFHWRSPSGKVLRYQGVNVPKGLAIRIAKLLAKGAKTLAIGGRYDLQNNNGGLVRPSFAYSIKQMWRGVRVVKMDGVMPLFTATLLPTAKGKAGAAYTLYGSITSKLNKRDNRLVCLYGTWFHLDAKRRPLRISQSRGLKGRSLFFFRKQFRHPRTWRQLPDAAARRKAYFAAKKRKAKGLPPIAKKLRIPTLSKEHYDKYLAECTKRLSKWERKFTSPTPKSTK